MKKILFFIILSIYFFVSQIHAQGLVKAKWTEDFVNSIGINGNFQMLDPALKIRMIESGIRFIRTPGFSSLLPAGEALYNEAGIKCLATAQPENSPQRNKDIFTQYREFIDAVESVNEPNVWPLTYGGLTDNPAANLYPATRKFSQEFNDLMKADPNTSAIPIGSVSFAGNTRAQIKGVLPLTKLDYKNIHFYPNSYWGPDTRPTQNDRTTQLDDLLPVLDEWTTSQNRIFMTEVGYSTKYVAGVPNDMCVTHLAYTKYASRIFTEMFIRGIARTYLFKLLGSNDETSRWRAICQDQAHDGKPYGAFYAIKNMIGLLSDASWQPTSKTWSIISYAPSSLNYTITGALPDTKSILLQKSNGDFYLLLWQNVNVFDTEGSKFINLYPPDNDITITINDNTIESATQYRSEPTDTTCNLKSTILNITDGKKISVAVPDNVMFIKIKLNGISTSTQTIKSNDRNIPPVCYLYPSKSILNIKLSGVSDTEAEVSLLSVSGQLIQKNHVNIENLPNPNVQFYLNTDLPAGLYLVNVRTNKSSNTCKIAIK